MVLTEPETVQGALLAVLTALATWPNVRHALMVTLLFRMEIVRNAQFQTVLLVQITQNVWPVALDISLTRLENAKKKDNNCVKWGSKGCLECPSQYFLNNDTGRCDECDTGCDKCSKANFCDKCSSGYSDFSQNGKCQKCSLNCLECNSKGCLTCKRDYLVDIQTGKCNTCASYLPNCKSCKIYDYCDTCSDPYFSKQGTCELCGPACGSCLSADRCTSCKDSNCKSCDPQAGCKSCNYGYFASASGNEKMKSCTSCGSAIENCKDCVNKDQCLKCVDGYFDVKETGRCEKCDDSCKTCSSSKDQCTECKSFYMSVNSDSRCTTSKTFVFIVLIAITVLGYFGIQYLRKQKKNAHALLDEVHSE